MKTEVKQAGIEGVSFRSEQPLSGLKKSAVRAEYREILKTLEAVNFNKSKAAKMLGVDRKTLYKKLKTYQSL